METESETSSSGASNNTSNSTRFWGMNSPALNFFRSPLSVILEYSGLLPPTSFSSSTSINTSSSTSASASASTSTSTSASTTSGAEEVSIRIIGAGEGEHEEHQPSSSSSSSSYSSSSSSSSSASDAESVPLVPPSPSEDTDTDTGNSLEDGSRGDSNSSHQRYDMHHLARSIEHFFPFLLLLLLVFIRQHLKGFFITICISAVMYKSNDIVRKQTALKGERKISVVVGISILFILHVIGVYWWCRSDDLLYPLVMIPPKAIPPFWNAVFIILVNDTMVRQAAMALKCLLLLYYKNGRGHNFRRQAQILTLVEYTLLLYRALLPTPVWYRFFLNKDHGSLFSSLTTGLYLTFKLTSVVEKVQSFFAALKALSRKEVQYGSYATSEQVNAAGDLCTICQEKMHAPILLRCKHIFCEDCVSEWFERERTCPLCRALVKSADLRTFGDGSTSLLFQIF